MNRRQLGWTTAVVALLVGGSIALVESRRATLVARRPLTADAGLDVVVPEAFREVTVPSGSVLALSFDDSVGSATSRVDDPVRAHLTKAVVVDGVVAVPEQSELSGAVVEATRSSRVKGRARVAVRFDSLRIVDGSTYSIRASTVTRTAAGTMKKDALKIGIPAAAGAVVGGLLGGGKGVAIGSAIGGGAGAGYVMSRRGPEVLIARGARLSVTLTDPMTVRVPRQAAGGEGPPFR